MTGTDLLLTNALVSALGWTLVHFLWQGCAIAALYWLVCALSPRDSAHLRYWAGIAGLFLSVAALAITFVVYYEPEAQFALGLPTADSVNSFLVLSGSSPDSWALLQDGIEPALPVIVFIWMLGVLVHSAQTVCGWVGVRRLIRKAEADIGDSLKTSAEHLMGLLGIRRSVRVLKSHLVKVPMAAGWLKPVILLPAGVLASLPRDQLEMIIAHELGHIRRNDYLFNLFQIVLETLLFYHPAIGWMSRRVREEREKCCDDLVVSRCGKPATYARALANLEVLRGPVAAAVLTATGGDLLGRIKRIINTELPRSSSGYAQMTLLAAVALVVAFGAQQGMLLSRALNLVAGSVHLQSSDIEWKTWGQSRQAWSEGFSRFAEQQEQWAPSLPIVNDSPKKKVRPDELAASQSEQQPARTTPSKAVEPAMPLIEELAFKPVRTVALAQIPPRPEPQIQTVDKPVPVSTKSPRYPWRARRDGVEGFVELAFSIDRKGHVTDIEVVDAMPSDTFERAAKKALKKWKFESQGEGAEPVRVVQTFDFSLVEPENTRRRERDCSVTGRRTCSRFPSNAIVVQVNPPDEKRAVVEYN